jgi:peptidyl-prolyl cis-trans isomerase D
VNGIEKPEPVAADRLASAQQQVAQVYAQAEMESYLDALKERSKVKITNMPTTAAADQTQ